MRVEMRRIAGEPRQLQIDQAQRHLRRGHRDPEHQRPARGDVRELLLRRPVDAFAVLDHAGGVLQQHGAVHRTPPIPCAIAQCSSASASASLSSAGAKPSRRTASITACLSALPLPVMCRLIVPTGHALVRDAVRLGPGGEMREVAAVGVAAVVPRCRRTSSNTTTPTPPDVSSISCSQRAEAQPDHAAALEPAGAELLDAAGDGAVAVADGPAGSLAQIEGEDHRWRRLAAGEHLDRHRCRSACIGFKFRQSHRSHGNLHRVVVVRAVASPAKAVATVRLALAVVVIGTHRSSPIAGCRSAHRLQAASRSLMHARSAGS